jgi:hypothetical protein
MQEPQNQPADKVRAALGMDGKAQHTDTEVTLNSATVGSGRNSIPGIPDHLQPLIQQQLLALETRQVQWQGQIWLNQEMNWKVREEQTRSPNGEEGKQWSTQIFLNLPNLGEVTATLRFAGSGLSVTLDADTGKTRNKLGSASSTLVSALSGRGISITSALVTQHPESS